MAMAHMKNKFRATTNLWLFFSTPAWAVRAQRPKHYELLLEGKWSHQIQVALARQTWPECYQVSQKKNPWTHTPCIQNTQRAPAWRKTPPKRPLIGRWPDFFLAFKAAGILFSWHLWRKITETLSVPWTSLWWPTSNSIAILKWAISSSGRIPIHFTITCRMPDNSRKLTCKIMEPEHMPKIQKRNSLNIIYELYMYVHH